MQKLNHRFGDDGSFWMSYEDLLRKYQTFDRTRLFVDDWKVTQQWTSFTVSWTSDYHSTKFSFTVEKETSVVLVLSQVRHLRIVRGT
jgi:C1A family cysteine protease